MKWTVRISALLRRAALTAFAVTACAVFAANVELPLRTVNGRQYFVYRVHRHDTVFGVANLLGISRDDIIAHNANAADGLKEGTYLYFPLEKFRDKFGVSVGQSPEAPAGDVSGMTSYVVKRGDTLFGISRKFGITPEQIISWNPSAETGVKVDQVLRIPADGAGQGQTNQSGDVDLENVPNQITPVKRDAVVVSTDVTTDEPVAEAAQGVDAVDADTAAVIPVPAREYTVAVALPFMLDREQGGRTAVTATDFYKGFLVAVDTLLYTAPHVRIIAMDTDNSAERTATLLNRDARLAEADLIIAPDNKEQLDVVAEFGQRHGVHVLNYGSTRDSAYISNPYVMQGLIPSSLMLSKAAQAFVDRLDGAMPVILRNNTGSDDKAGFVNIFIQNCLENGITPIDLSYEGALTRAELDEQLGEAGPQTRYVFIPVSGTLNEFNKFSVALSKYRADVVAVGGDVRLYGYPEWSAFRNDALSELHRLDAVIYTRSFSDMGSMQARGVNGSFVRWYGTGMNDGVPVQGLLGYDTGCFVLKALAAGMLENNKPSEWKSYDLPVADTGDGMSDGQSVDWDGVQSSYRFRRLAGAAGPVNAALYIVSFRPGELIQTEVL